MGAEEKPPEDLSLEEWLSLVACFFMPQGKLGQAGMAIRCLYLLPWVFVGEL